MEIYCNQMGMVLPISYCISVNEGVPCRNCVRCWSARVDIGALLKERFSQEDLRRAFGGPPKSRIERIVESIEKVR